MVGHLVCVDSSADCEKIDASEWCSKGASTVVPCSSLVDQTVVESHNSPVDRFACSSRAKNAISGTEQLVQAKAAPVRV
jgi:hypothetical protein